MSEIYNDIDQGRIVYGRRPLPEIFSDRHDAGRRLAEKLENYKDDKNLIILALPRGGVPVAYEIAQKLKAPFDVFIVRKLGVPGHEELALGAIASGGIKVINEDLKRALKISDQEVEVIALNEMRELKRREKIYGSHITEIDIKDKTVILVDDGLATGATMKAASKAIKLMKPNKLIIVVPVASINACQEMQKMADEAICAYTPDPFHGVGVWYENFQQMKDEEVMSLLGRNTGN